MKRFILPVIALTFLVGACSSPTKTSSKQSPPPVSTGMRTTAWGELPTYDSTGQRFSFVRIPHPPPGVLVTATVTLDVVVNADGSVKDAIIMDGSGNATIDYAVLASFIGARYSLQLGPDNPAPYVVRQKMELRQEDGILVSSSWGHPYEGMGRPGPEGSLPPYNSSYWGRGWSSN